MGCNHVFKPFTRRQALTRLGGGFGLIALSQMLNTTLAQAAAAPNIPTGGVGGILPGLHFKPKAKRVIFLMMNGGVSHVDTFDYKPMLDKYDGKPLPGAVASAASERATPGSIWNGRGVANAALSSRFA